MKKKIYILFLKILTIIFLLNIYYFCLYKNGIFIPCLFHEITGLYCPGCGVTRMVISLFRLDFYQAFRYNAFLFIFFPFILVFLIDFILKWICHSQSYLYRKIPNHVWNILLIITLLFGVLRNIPIFDYFIPITL